jgi:hypothetical protein
MNRYRYMLVFDMVWFVCIILYLGVLIGEHRFDWLFTVYVVLAVSQIALTFLNYYICFQQGRLNHWTNN